MFKFMKLKRLQRELADAKFELKKWYHIDARRIVLTRNVDILEAKLRRLKK